ncbi:MAG: hypothetical protein KC619_35710, partial [Myxococcales bacterium]|nr:hypothetical protein [Myxococcales bacterium]
MSDAYAVEAALERASARWSDALRAISTQPRTDLSGMAPSAVAYLASQLPPARRALVLTRDDAAARELARDLRSFSGDADAALYYPGYENSPFVDVAPDRRASMQRLATLFHLAHGLPWRFVVAPLSALARRTTPRDAIERSSMVVRAEDEIDRDRLVRVLVEGGYVRVPVVEDPGTFAVRGSLIDVYPPHAEQPARIDLDDWLVLSIKGFDPDDQRTLDPIAEIHVHPVRDALHGDDEIALAKLRVRDLCDEMNLPTRQTKQLLEDLESGRLYLGAEAYL